MTQEDESRDEDGPEKPGADEDEATRDEASREARSRKERMSGGIRQGIGVLSAFRDALEETIQEARDRGDLSTDRAREVMKDALGKAQTAAEGAKERLDFVSQADLDAVKRTVDSLGERLGDLEVSVFGSSRASDTTAPESGQTKESTDG